ncbi:hypothetical protein [Stieleria varia]|uniref:Uncharacterized protein n=1 Tax=Stieleria varia TaxID=2528005 RepID=A0A5C6B026_9BACT|nr:hypothetical protein [Stieleria varia]TWU04732.1 hypothetical protein Pla52n_27750 [Stieleria varia]
MFWDFDVTIGFRVITEDPEKQSKAIQKKLLATKEVALSNIQDLTDCDEEQIRVPCSSPAWLKPCDFASGLPGSIDLQARFSSKLSKWLEKAFWRPSQFDQNFSFKWDSGIAISIDRSRNNIRERLFDGFSVTFDPSRDEIPMPELTRIYAQIAEKLGVEDHLEVGDASVQFVPDRIDLKDYQFFAASCRPSTAKCPDWICCRLMRTKKTSKHVWEMVQKVAFAEFGPPDWAFLEKNAFPDELPELIDECMTISNRWTCSLDISFDSFDPFSADVIVSPQVHPVWRCTKRDRTMKDHLILQVSVEHTGAEANLLLHTTGTPKWLSQFVQKAKLHGSMLTQDDLFITENDLVKSR